MPTQPCKTCGHPFAKHAGPPIGRMHGAVEMGARVHRGFDALGDDADRLQVLRVIHLVAGITDPAGGVDAHGVGEIDDLHGNWLFRLALSAWQGSMVQNL